MRRRLTRTLAAAVLAALALPAHAMAGQTYVVSGSITYTWQGDPARGCATEGLCGVQGSLTVPSQGNAVSGTGGSPGRVIVVGTDTSESTVRVADGPGGGDCVDVLGAPGEGALLIAREAGGRMVAHIEEPLSSGRCAGPRPQDLARLALPVRTSGGGHPTFDLHTTRSFAAGPFTGKLVSTLVVRSFPNRGGSQSVSSGPSPVAPRPTHKVFLEHVTLRYRIASLRSSSLEATFAGEPDPFCTAFDSCGATGTLALAFRRFQQTLVVDGFRRVGKRVDGRRALADFKRGRLHLVGGTGRRLRPDISVRVAETFVGPDGSPCQDTSAIRRAPLFFSAGPARRGPGLSVVLNDPMDLGMLRTHCPGPTDTDVLGTNPVLAARSIGVAHLLDRRSVISLSRPGSFAGTGYVGTRAGALGFSLTLERVQAGTTEVNRP